MFLAGHSVAMVTYFMKSAIRARGRAERIWPKSKSAHDLIVFRRRKIIRHSSWIMPVVTISRVTFKKTALTRGSYFKLLRTFLSLRATPDDDWKVSHDASRLGLYYHCVRDVIIYFTLSGRNHGVLSCLSEWITVWIAWLCFQGYRFNLYSLRFQWEFCRYSEGFYFRFVGLSRSTYKLCGNHVQTKKISHPCSCYEFACGRIIRWGKKPWADTNIKVLVVISRYKASQDSAIVSGLLTEKSDFRSCFSVLTRQHRRGQCEVCCETVSLF